MVPQSGQSGLVTMSRERSNIRPVRWFPSASTLRLYLYHHTSFSSLPPASQSNSRHLRREYFLNHMPQKSYALLPSFLSRSIGIPGAFDRSTCRPYSRSSFIHRPAPLSSALDCTCIPVSSSAALDRHAPFCLVDPMAARIHQVSSHLSTTTMSETVSAGACIARVPECPLVDMVVRRQRLGMKCLLRRPMRASFLWHCALFHLTWYDWTTASSS